MWHVMCTCCVQHQLSMVCSNEIPWLDFSRLSRLHQNMSKLRTKYWQNDCPVLTTSYTKPMGMLKLVLDVQVPVQRHVRCTCHAHVVHFINFQWSAVMKSRDWASADCQLVINTVDPTLKDVYSIAVVSYTPYTLSIHGTSDYLSRSHPILCTTKGHPRYPIYTTYIQ